MTTEQEKVIFKQITDRMNEVFAQKREDYGPSTTETWTKFGPVSMLTRIHDKMSRIDNLLVNKKEAQVKSEKVQDTLLDLANYCVITILEMVKENEKRTHCERC